MKKYYLAIGLLALSMVSLPASKALAADQQLTREQTQVQDQKRVYGWEMMTDAERTEHSAKMRSLNTEQEREQYRQEHHKKMQERAKERGATLPDEPMPRGKGMGMGQGQGRGMGGPHGKGGGY